MQVIKLCLLLLFAGVVYDFVDHDSPNLALQPAFIIIILLLRMLKIFQLLQSRKLSFMGV